MIVTDNSDLHYTLDSTKVSRYPIAKIIRGIAGNTSWAIARWGKGGAADVLNVPPSA